MGQSVVCPLRFEAFFSGNGMNKKLQDMNTQRTMKKGWLRVMRGALVTLLLLGGMMLGGMTV